MARQSGAVARLRGFPSPDLLLRRLMLHVARGHSLPETVVRRANLAKSTDISNVALFKRLRKSGGWLRSLCMELLRDNGAYPLEDIGRTIRIVDGTLVRELRSTTAPGGSRTSITAKASRTARVLRLSRLQP
jgi:hypothetical protein